MSDVPSLETKDATETPRECASNNCRNTVSDPQSIQCQECLDSIQVQEDAGWQMHINGWS